MLQILIKSVFYVITKLYDLILAPFFVALYALFPSVSVYFTYIENFLDTAFTYFGTCLDLFLIPREALLLLFNYFAIKYSIYLIRLSIKFAIKVYNLFKL